MNLIKAPSSLEADFLDTAKSKGLIGLLILSCERGVDLVGDAEASMIAIKALRLARRQADVQRLAIEVSQRHIDNPTVVAGCIHALHRCGAWEEALDVLGQGKSIRSIKADTNLAAVEADCQFHRGRFRLARHLAKAIKANRLAGPYRTILNRLLDTPLPAICSEAERIEHLFDTGALEEATQAFHAFLQQTRHGAKQKDGVRDIESAKFAAAFDMKGTNAAKTKPTVSFLTDSIALPRPTIGVAIEDTYPWLTRERLSAALGRKIGVQINCTRGSTMRDARESIQAIAPSDALVLQMGIVDCAPRIFSDTDVKGIRAIYGDPTAEAIVTLGSIHRRLLQGARTESVYVSLKDFERFLIEILEFAVPRHKTIVVVNIVGPGHGGSQKKVGAFAENIAEYNLVLSKAAERFNCDFVDLNSILWGRADASRCFSGDNYHYNGMGHVVGADTLSSRLLPKLKMLT